MKVQISDMILLSEEVLKYKQHKMQTVQ